MTLPDALFVDSGLALPWLVMRDVGGEPRLHGKLVEGPRRGRAHGSPGRRPRLAPTGEIHLGGGVRYLEVPGGLLILSFGTGASCRRTCRSQA
ncbi:MAG: hypothetical protein M3O70_25065 [Actinomycetota bacterium]|nr:hypothetical protein [Actinomycetota bacterium]